MLLKHKEKLLYLIIVILSIPYALTYFRFVSNLGIMDGTKMLLLFIGIMCGHDTR